MSAVRAPLLPFLSHQQPSSKRSSEEKRIKILEGIIDDVFSREVIKIHLLIEAQSYTQGLKRKKRLAHTINVPLSENIKSYARISIGNKISFVKYLHAALQAAMSHGKPHTVRSLILKGKIPAKDLKAKSDQYGNNLLHYAVRSNDMDLVAYLMRIAPELFDEMNKANRIPIEYQQPAPIIFLTQGCQKKSSKYPADIYVSIAPFLNIKSKHLTNMRERYRQWAKNHTLLLLTLGCEEKSSQYPSKIYSLLAPFLSIPSLRLQKTIKAYRFWKQQKNSAIRENAPHIR